MPSPRVSIICAFYNGANFLGEAIDSVLAQDFADYELLLVDDGSTDGSSEIARDYVARYPELFRYLEHPGHVNRGAAPSKNLGLREATGEFVAFIDSDDVWRPAKLREQVELLDRCPEAGMVCGAVNYWSSWDGGKDRVIPTGHLRDELSRPPETLVALYPLGDADAPCPSDIMFRRAIFEEGCSFDEQLTGPVQMYEDQTFFVKVYLGWPVFFSTRVWLDYRQHPDSCVSTVYREGFYPQMRRDFLGWTADYVDGRDFAGKSEVERSIAAARWEMDHPALGRLLRRVRRLWWKLRR